METNSILLTAIFGVLILISFQLSKLMIQVAKLALQIVTEFGMLVDLLIAIN